MTTAKTDIIAQLRQDILRLQQPKTPLHTGETEIWLGPIKQAFANARFPLAAVHEFVYSVPEEATATSGFISSLLAALMRDQGVTIWISPCRDLFPSALPSFGVCPEKIIFITLHKQNDILWVMEEALACAGLAAVVAEVKDLSFNASRRLQLAVEKSQVTGFVLRNDPLAVQTTACYTRWRIRAQSSRTEEDMPGVGFPRWRIELLKVRNGRPGTWEVEFAEGRLRNAEDSKLIRLHPRKKTG